jgi:hypothetical protein
MKRKTIKAINKKSLALIFGILFTSSALADTAMAFQTKTATPSQQLSMLDASVLSHPINRNFSFHNAYFYTIDDEEHNLPCNYGHPHCQCFDDHCVEQE